MTRFSATVLIVAMTFEPALAVQAKGAAQTPDQPAIDQLRQMFERSRNPSENELLGQWVLIRHVMTERFLTGRSGPDHVLFEANGIRRTNQSGSPLEWIVTFERRTDGKLRVRSDTAWVPRGDVANLDFDSPGEFRFEKDYAGDSAWVYRCREATNRQLLCLLSGHETGHGIVFLKMTPPNPR